MLTGTLRAFSGLPSADRHRVASSQSQLPPFFLDRGVEHSTESALEMLVNSRLADPVIKARFADLGCTVFPTSPAEFGKFIADETEKWGKVVRGANIRAN